MGEWRADLMKMTNEYTDELEKALRDRLIEIYEIDKAELATYVSLVEDRVYEKLQRECQSKVKDALEQAASLEITFGELKTTNKNMLAVAAQMKLALDELIARYRVAIRALIQDTKEVNDGINENQVSFGMNEFSYDVIPYSENNEYIVLMNDLKYRTCKFTPTFSGLMFTDCTHPAQNMLVNKDNIIKWKVNEQIKGSDPMLLVKI